MPGSDPLKVEKAVALAADKVVVDLEDAVAVGAKNSARDLLASTLSTQTLRYPSRIAVRVNAAHSPWCHHDVTAIATLDGPRARSSCRRSRVQETSPSSTGSSTARSTPREGPRDSACRR